MTAIGCDNRNWHRFISAKIRHFCGHNFIWKINECMPLALFFHHLLITLRAAWEISPIRKVQGFSTPLLFLGRHWCLSCGKISQPGLVYKLQTQPQCTCIYNGRRHGRSHHMQWCHITSCRQNAVTQGAVLDHYNLYILGVVLIQKRSDTVELY